MNPTREVLGFHPTALDQPLPVSVIQGRASVQSSLQLKLQEVCNFGPSAIDEPMTDRCMHQSNFVQWQNQWLLSALPVIGWIDAPTEETIGWSDGVLFQRTYSTASFVSLAYIYPPRVICAAIDTMNTSSSQWEKDSLLVLYWVSFIYTWSWVGSCQVTGSNFLAHARPVTLLGWVQVF